MIRGGAIAVLKFWLSGPDVFLQAHCFHSLAKGDETRAKQKSEPEDPDYYGALDTPRVVLSTVLGKILWMPRYWRDGD